eukprot:GHVN01010602.1.p1 GENE.GHVN01010602.1~~GHVN01010602.1.p1  ORF type:complete len:208 (+),score=38.16 GHVN01010602.1:45-626(+)
MGLGRVVTSVSALLLLVVGVSGFQGRKSNDLARLLNRNRQQPLEFQENVIGADRSDADLSQFGDVVLTDEQLANLELLAQLVASEDGTVGRSDEEINLTADEANSLLSQLYSNELDNGAEGGVAVEQMLQDIETLSAGLPQEEANRVALAYVLDTFNLDMSESHFNTLVNQINSVESAYATLANTLDSLQVEE